MALFSLPLDRFVACLTSLLSLGLLTMPLTGPLIDPLTAALMLSGSISTVLGVELAGDQDWRFFLFCSLCVLFWEESFGDCITDRRNRLADSRETARLNMGLRFGEALRYVGGSGVGAAYNALMRMRPAGVRRGLKKSRLESVREWRCDSGAVVGRAGAGAGAGDGGVGV
jgi:hypothetical protein